MEMNQFLPEFQNFLISKKKLSEKKASFYAYWAYKFIVFIERNKNIPKIGKEECLPL